MTTLRPAVVFVAAFTLVTGVVYPLVVTAVAHLAWPDQATGSLVRVDGRVVGSRLIGQRFTNPGYLWGRPSAIDHDARTSGGTNLGPTSAALSSAIRTRASRLAIDAPGRPVPVDLVTSSASGLDPEISPAGARFQIERIARARGVDAGAVAAVVERAIAPRTLGVLGAPRVNVLAVNLALDRRFGPPPSAHATLTAP